MDIGDSLPHEDMLNFPGCLAGNGADMSVLQRQQLRLNYSLLQQQHQFQPKSFDFSAMPQFQGLLLQHSSTAFPVHGDGNEFRSASASSPEMATSSLDMEHSALSRASVPVMKEELEEESGLMKMMKCTVARNSFNKRKAESIIAEESRDKRRNRGAVDEDDHCAQTPNENSKIPDAQDQKQDYVHVRARRGQATDSHSLAERARREKINKKMKSLQELVPGCHKTTGKAGMLDEIINYVQSLQRQVEFLSMKLAHVNPRIELSIDNIFTKEFPACVSATLSEMANLSYNQPNSVQPVAANCEMDMLMPLNPLQTAQPRVSSSPVSQVQSLLPWETDLQNFYNGGFQ